MSDVITTREKSVIPELDLRLVRAAVQVSLFFFAFVFVAVVGAQAQVTSLTMSSDPNDYIGGGQFYFFTPANGTFTQQGGSSQHVSISFATPSYSQWWYLDFAAPSGQSLAPGNYTGAARYPFQASNQPGLSVVGDGRGCDTVTGSFQVLQASFDNIGNVLAFDATFVQYCEGGTAALRGEIRYNASVVINVTAPTTLTAIEGQNLNFNVTSTDSQTPHVTMTAAGVPSGASFVDNGNNSGTFNWTPGAAQAGTYLLTFTGSDGLGNRGGTYTQITVIPPPPPNDDFNDATQIRTFPYSINYDATNATTAPDDPFCYGANQTVWFAYTPTTNIRLEANTFGSSYDTTLSVYTGTRGALTQIACNDDSNGTVQSRVRFDATAGTTYYFMVSSLYPVNPADLNFNLLQAPPPFTFSPTVAQFGSVKASEGTATVSGIVTCDQPAYVYISGELKQMHGGSPVDGSFFTSVACDGTTPWSVTVQTQTSLFHGRSVLLYTGGKASVTGTASAIDPETGDYLQRNFAVKITLRGAQ
jgi:Putative Ig domain